MGILNRTRARAVVADLGAYGHDITAVIVAAGLLTLLMALDVTAGMLFLLRILLGLGLVLVAPGYCILALLCPRPADLDLPARIGLSMAVSIGLVPVLALILDHTPWHLRPWSILGAVISFCLVAGVGVLWRRAGQPSAPSNWPRFTWPQAWLSSTLSLRRRVLTLAALALLLPGLPLIASAFAAQHTRAEFYLLGPGQQATDYPRDLRVGQPVVTTVGVNNPSATAESFYVELWVINSWTGLRQKLVTTEPFVVGGGGKQEFPVRWTMPWGGAEQHVEFLLLTGREAVVARKLKLVLDVDAATAPQATPP